MKKVKGYLDYAFVFVMAAGVCLALFRIFGEVKYDIAISFAIIGLGVVLLIADKLLDVLIDGRKKTAPCPRCGNTKIDLLQSHRTFLPTYFCECGKCLMRSEYKHTKEQAVIDWNCTNLTQL